MQYCNADSRAGVQDTVALALLGMYVNDVRVANLVRQFKCNTLVAMCAHFLLPEPEVCLAVMHAHVASAACARKAHVYK
jgi:hypothetical protein